MVLDPRWEKNQRVAEAAALSANDLIPALEQIIEEEAWREFIHPMRGLMTFATFGDYCREFVGITPEAVEALLDRSEFKAAAMTVRKLLREAVEPIAGHGEIGNGRSRVCIANSTRAVDAQYVAARLKRDDPDLAEQVVEGRISPHAAAIQAGIRKPRATYRTDDPVLAVKAVLRHFTKQQLIDALEATP